MSYGIICVTPIELYEEFWEEMLQGVRLVSWTLVVPDNEDKDVLKHARRKATELMKKNLPFIDVAFQGHVCTDRTGFPLAYQKLLECGIAKIHIPPGQVGPEQVETFSASRPDFVRNIDTKVAKLLPNNAE